MLNRLISKLGWALLAFSEDTTVDNPFGSPPFDLPKFPEMPQIHSCNRYFFIAYNYYGTEHANGGRTLCGAANATVSMQCGLNVNSISGVEAYIKSHFIPKEVFNPRIVIMSIVEIDEAPTT